MGKFDLIGCFYSCISTLRGHPILLGVLVAIILLLALLIAYGAQNVCTPTAGRWRAVQWESNLSAPYLQGEGRRWTGASLWNCATLGFMR